MAESPSSNPTFAETGEGAVASRIDGVSPAPEIVLTEDGVPVIDLREPALRDGALVVVDGVLLLRLADGNEWPIDVTVAEGDVVLQVADRGFIAASSLQAALAGADTALPLADLGAAAAQAAAPSSETAADTAMAAEPAAADEPPAHGGGASFRAYEVGTIGPGLDPLLALGPTELGGTGGISDPLSDLFGDPFDEFGATGPGNGSRFVNLAPIAKDDLATTNERQSIDIDVLANDRDPNPGDRIRIVGVQAEGLEGVVSLNADGTINYDPNGQFTHLGVGEHATESFRYTIADQHGKTSSATVTVRITGLNDAPVANDDFAKTNEKHAVKIDVLANDVDPDINDVLQVVGVDTTGLVGNLQYLGDGKFLYDPAGRFDYLGKGHTATETFRYAVSDPHGAVDIATVQIQIQGVNDAPVANDDFVIVSEKGQVRFNPLANDFDPDQGDTIRVTNLFSLGNSAGQRWINHDGTVTYRPAGAYDYLGKGEYAYQQFGYTIADQHGATDTGVITVKIVGVNDAPVAKDDKVHTDEKSLVEINVLANDFDPDKNDTIGVVAVDASGLEGELTYLGDGKFHYDPAGQFDYLGLGHTAVETFRYMISDQHGATDIATVEILIHGVNDAPVAVDDHFVGFATIGFYTPIASLLANDYDVDQGDTFHFAGLGNAVNGQVSLTPDGYVVFTPEAGFIGEAGFQYAIVDQHGAYGIGNVYVDVRPIEPGDMNYMTWTWFSGVSQAEVEVLANGVTLLDLAIEIGAVAGAGLEIGGMPFYSATLAGVLQGVISVAILPDGTPLVTGNLVGDLDMQIQTSPIFAPLGGDVYDALFAAMGGAEQLTLLGGGGGGLPAVPDLGFAAALYDLVEQVAQSIDLSGLDILVAGQGLGDTNAVAFGNGVFYLDISGLISGAIEVPGGHAGQPLIDAEIFGQFAAAAIMDIRDDLTVVSDGFVTGDFDVAVAASGVDAGFAIGSIVSEELALAA